MKKSRIIFAVFLSVLLYSCSTAKYASVEDSEIKIRQYSARNYSLDSLIKLQSKQEPLNRNVQIKISKNLLNSLLQRLASAQNMDISFLFLSSPKIFNEDKSALGIKYSNYVDLKGGKLDVNIKSLKILDFFTGKVTAQLELEGKGNLDVNGHYMGVPASAKPDVEVYLNEKVTFLLEPTNNGNLLLKPDNQTLHLKIKISVRLLGWAVPYTKEIPLEMTQLVKPIEIPLNFPLNCQLPEPSRNPQNLTFVQVPYKLHFINSSINSDKSFIEYKTDVVFETMNK